MRLDLKFPPWYNRNKQKVIKDSPLAMLEYKIRRMEDDDDFWDYVLAKDIIRKAEKRQVKFRDVYPTRKQEVSE